MLDKALDRTLLQIFSSGFFNVQWNNFSERQDNLAFSLTSAFSLVGNPVLLRNAFHAVDLYFYVVPPCDGIGNFRDYLFVHLRAVDGEPWGSVQLLVADMTLEMLGFLMKGQNLLVVKVTIAIPLLEEVKGLLTTKQNRLSIHK